MSHQTLHPIGRCGPHEHTNTELGWPHKCAFPRFTSALSLEDIIHLLLMAPLEAQHLSEDPPDHHLPGCGRVTPGTAPGIYPVLSLPILNLLQHFLLCTHILYTTKAKPPISA